MENRNSRKITYREITSRTTSLSPPSRSGLSPLTKHNAGTPGRSVRFAIDDNSVVRNRWPSSKKSGGSSLSECLADDHITDAVEPGEFSRFEETTKKDKDDQEKYENMISKEIRPRGGSLRYTGKLRFNNLLKSEAESPPTRATLTSIKRTDYGVHTPSLESNRTDPTKGQSPKLPLTRKKDKSVARVSSMPSKRAASPGRSSSPLPRYSEGGRTPSRSFSSMQAANPVKGRKVGSIISMGLDLFRRKPDTGSDTETGKALTPSPSSSFTARTDTGYDQLRLMQNYLIQWQYVNARSDSINQTKATEAESALASAWVGIANLRASVMHKTMQMEREKLKLKVYRVLGSQIKALDGWGKIEKQHTVAVSATKDSLEAAVCRLPIVDLAKADAQLLSIWFRQASNLSATMETTIKTFSHTAQNTVKLLRELAQVAAQERALLQECLDAMRHASSLQIQEQSLRCHLVQLKPSQRTIVSQIEKFTVLNENLQFGKEFKCMISIRLGVRRVTQA